MLFCCSFAIQLDANDVKRFSAIPHVCHAFVKKIEAVLSFVTHLWSCIYGDYFVLLQISERSPSLAKKKKQK